MPLQCLPLKLDLEITGEAMWFLNVDWDIPAALRLTPPSPHIHVPCC